MGKSAESADGNLGNTITKFPKKSIKEVKRWCFTYNNYDDNTIKTLKTAFSALDCQWIFGHEKAPETGTPHLQGYINLKIKKGLIALKKILGCDKIHLEPCKGSEKQNVDYCTKEGNYESNFVKVVKPLKLISQLKPWQLEIEKLIKTEPDGRSVHWYWENTGGVGKSAFCKYMFVKHKALVIQGGKLADIMNILFNYDLDSLEMVIIDVPRKNGNKISYSAVECILNGMITNTKYETGIKVFNPPHVVIFSNFEPDYSELSEDRWVVTNIKV